MTTHSSILAWKVPWTEEPGGLQRRLVGYSPGGHKESDMTERLSTHTHLNKSHRTWEEQICRHWN